MKKFITLLEKPKVIIPVFAVIAIVVGIILYRNVGNAPTVSTALIPSSITSASSEVLASGSNVSLSFAKSGQVQEISAKVGDSVKQGQIIAKLSAPDSEGAVSQTKGALDLAKAQYASINSQYATTKTQQDQLVENAYRTLLSSGLEATPSVQDPNVPIISGTYTCDKVGSYTLKPYASGENGSGFSFNFTGLESGTFGAKYDNAVPLGNCGLQIKFVQSDSSSFNPTTTWTINIPNTKSSVYLANKNAYDLATANRDKVLSDLANTIGSNGSGAGSVAQAQIDAAQGAYDAALGLYQNSLIVAPADGTITFIDPNLKVGQAVTPYKPVISINVK